MSSLKKIFLKKIIPIVVAIKRVAMELEKKLNTIYIHNILYLFERKGQDKCLAHCRWKRHVERTINFIVLDVLHKSDRQTSDLKWKWLTKSDCEIK